VAVYGAMEHGPSNEQLMAEMAWVRRLARALVRDDVVADDVTQDAWIVAAEREPDADRPLRPWLARVVNNLVRTRRRAELRRGMREAASGDARTTLTPAELVERVELQQVVADEVLALTEPYRSIILLHFFEGVSSAEVAQRLGVPAGTVRRRLKVGLDQLREALRARTDQPQRGWLAALAPIAYAPSHVSSTAIGALAMKKVIAIIVSILLLLAAGFMWRRHRSEASARAPASTTAPTTVGFAHVSDRRLVPSWLTQADVAPREIAGRVVAGGAPVAGAIVKLALVLQDGVLEPIADTKSAADGSFSFGPQPAALFSVSAVAVNHAPAAITVALADPKATFEHLVLELGDCHARLFGAITDAGGGRIAKARVLSAGRGGVESDANGHFSACLASVDLPGTATAFVRVEADGYGTVEERVIVVGELHHDFLLAPEAVLVGRVTANDRPVAGARVIATPDLGERTHFAAGNAAESDSDGRFRIAGLAPAKFQLAAYAEHLGTAAPVLTIARPAATSHDIHLALVAFATVRGRVVMAGVPVAGAAVSVNGQGVASMSQPDGSFELDRVPYGTTTLVAAPYKVRTPTTLAVIAARVDGVELEVGRLAAIHGHVTRKGAAVAHANITCGTGEFPMHAAKADTAGAYIVDGLPAGVVVCSAWDPRDRTFAVPPQFELDAAEDKTFDFDLDCAGKIQGTVVDEAGLAVGGAYVRFDIVNNGVDSCEATTDPSGAFDCGALSGGEYVAMVSPSPGARQPFAPASRFDPIQVPKDGVVSGVKLAIRNRRLAIRGTVADPAGTALPDVRVRALGRGRAGMNLPSTLSDAEGHFEIGDLAPGNYNLDATAADGSEAEVNGIASGSDGVSITLPRVGAIDGTLVGFSTTPSVSAVTSTADLHIGAAAIVDGTTFSLSGLTPGRYIIEAAAGTELDATSVEVRSGETAHVTLTSRGLGAIDGRITELESHAAVPGMRCDSNLSIGGDGSMGGPPDGSRSGMTDANGHFTISAPVGRVRVFCFFPAGSSMSAAGTDVDVATNAVSNAALVSVRATYGASPGDVGFTLKFGVLPPTVAQVDPKGPAATSLVPGDQLVTIDGMSLQGMLPVGVMTLLMNHKPGSTVVLGLATRAVSLVVAGG
jgi:RNA polymerase sigma factor (sigma-70 family)